MSFTENAWAVFNQSVKDYHVKDNVNSEEKNKMIMFIIYKFAWIILLVLGLGVLFLALLAIDVPY